MLDRLRYLRNQLRAKCLELSRGIAGTPEKLAEHAGAISEAVSLLTRFINEQNPENEPEKVNMAMNVFWQLPGCDSIYQRLSDMEINLRKGIDKLYRVYNKIKNKMAQQNPTIKNNVKSATSKKDAQRVLMAMLNSLHSSFFEVDKVINSITEKSFYINRDWDCNVSQIWTDEELGKKPHRPQSA